MRLNILSDLHLGLGNLDPPATDADVVILAGDVSRPREAIAWASQLEKPVLYVAGNHEFYGGSLSGTVEALKTFAASSAVRVLDDEEIVLGGVRFLGTTLWTDFMLFGDGPRRDAAINEAHRFMRDFSRIRTDDVSREVFTPHDAAARFRTHSAWLAARLAEPTEVPTVVITHHAPSRRSIHTRFAESLLNACFVSDLERLMDRRRAVLWVHGHTHDSFDYTVNGTRVVCNPRGYAKDGVNENACFDPTLVIDV
jgi:predicted phosphodiesterase